MQDKKHGGTSLDAELDDYWKNKEEDDPTDKGSTVCKYVYVNLHCSDDLSFWARAMISRFELEVRCKHEQA